MEGLHVFEPLHIKSFSRTYKVNFSEDVFNKIKNLESPATCLSLDFFCSLLSEVELVFLENEDLQDLAFSFFDIGVGVSNYRKINDNRQLYVVM